MAGNVSYGSLPFSEQIAFFRRKFNTKTDAWTDVYGSAHDNEFMVAGANRDALLADLRTAVEKSLDGGTLETFRKDFAAIVARYGWSYNGGFEWRSRIIYETNLRSSYMAGRYQQLMDMRDTHPYWGMSTAWLSIRARSIWAGTAWCCGQTTRGGFTTSQSMPGVVSAV
jgi:hypothetical protein